MKKTLNAVIRSFLLVIALQAAVILAANAQTYTPDSLQKTSTTAPNPLQISGYVDTYYIYDFNQPQNHVRPVFIYNHNRANEFNVNLALIQLTYNTEKVRGNLGLMSGTYVQYNLANEQDLLKHLYQANAGIKLSKKLWFDAGIFISHIGAESAITMDNLNMTRSIAAETTPYYETGAKLTFEATNKLTVTGLIVNGWQNIRENNNDKAFGTQLQYKLNDKILLNYSTFIGNEKPDSIPKQIRFFQDLYATIHATDKLSLIAWFDYGMEEKPNGESGTNKWWNSTLSIKYQLTKAVGIAARGEYYKDKNGVIIATDTKNGAQIAGYSMNVDYTPSKQVMWRVEGRVFNSNDDIFTNENLKPTDKNAFVGSSLSLKF